MDIKSVAIYSNNNFVMQVLASYIVGMCHTF